MFGEISGAIFSSQGVMLLIVFVLTLYFACNLFFDVRVPDLDLPAKVGRTRIVPRGTPVLPKK